MKIIVFFICLFSVCQPVFSQNLEGEWEGSFVSSKTKLNETTKLKLVFVKLNDSVYKAFSKTFFNSTDSVICILEGGFTNKHTLYLEEKSAIANTSNNDEMCLQMMELFYAKGKKRTSLSGNWLTVNNRCGSGTLSVFKVN